MLCLCVFEDCELGGDWVRSVVGRPRQVCARGEALGGVLWPVKQNRGDCVVGEYGDLLFPDGVVFQPICRRNDEVPFRV